MAFRDKIVERVQPYLEPGEVVHQVFLGQTGPNPWLATGVFGLFLSKPYVFAVTDRSILVLRAHKFVPAKPKTLEARLPRTTVIGPLSGVWAKCMALGPTMYVLKRFHQDVAEADAAITGSAPGFQSA
jgi:hypothetical protein